MNRSRNHAGQRRHTARRALTLGFGAALTFAGCDNILDVELPGQITEEETFIPAQAAILVASGIADVECAMAEFIAFNAAGAEDAATKSVGWWGTAFQYGNSPGTGGNCNTSDTGIAWFVPMHKGRLMAEQVYDRLENEWTDAEVENREQLMATAAIYAGVTYTFFGEYFCEVSANTGPLMSWEESLQEAERWFDLALTHIQSTGDFPVTSDIASSAQQMTHLLRARARFARDDFAGAEQDALEVQMGFTAWITRDGGGVRSRWNRVYNAHLEQGTWVPVVGPVDYWTGPPNPATGEPWPGVIPFTGYWDLGILPDGRATTDEQHPITTTAFEAAVADARVPVVDSGSDRGGPRLYPIFLSQKYTSQEDFIPLAKWEEAWLILAQIRGGQEAIDRVNDIRNAMGLPEVSYLAATDADGIRDLLIEEIRRTHYLEGRFWATKLRYGLWFPRGVGQDAWGQSYSTAVRMVMPTNEFQINPNLDESDRGSMCPANQSPV